MQKKDVRYTENEIVVTVPTKCPEDLHEQLLQSLSTAIEKTATHPEATDADRQSVIYLTYLLKAMMPAARQLQKSFSVFIIFLIILPTSIFS